jgi:hypothetical protein
VDNPIKGLPEKQQKVLIFVGIGAAAYVTYRWFTNRSSSSSTPTTVTSSTDAEQASTGVIGSNVGASENVGNSSNTGSGTITSNSDWFNQAVDKLANAGWNAQAVQSALGEFLTGQNLDSSEVAIVRAAVGAMGGYPPSGPQTITETPGVTDVSKLPAPTGLRVIGHTDTSVNLAWNPVPGAKQYRVYRSGFQDNVGGSMDTNQNIGGLEPNTTYTFYVAAGLDGEKMGPRSAGVTVKTDGKKLSAPSGLKISDITRNSAVLRWNSTYGQGYLIRRSGSSLTSESVDPATRLDGLKPGTRYSYQVAAVTPGTRTPGPWSSYVTFTTKR